jgi:hypothetical protein
MPLNVRRGLTRLYLVLWALWIPVAFWYAHEYYLITDVVYWSQRALEHESAGLDAVARSERALVDEYKREWEGSWRPLFGLVGIGLPALLYGLLYGSIMTLRGVVRWVVCGFKPDAPR